MKCGSAGLVRQGEVRHGGARRGVARAQCAINERAIMSKAFFGGMPTGFDVTKLIDAFGDRTEGAQITHDEIESVIGVERTENRYRAITGAWRRKMLADSNIDIGAINGIGFEVRSPEGRMSHSIKGFQSGTRKQMRAVKRALLVKTEDPILRQRQDLMQRMGAAIASEASTLMKAIDPPKAVEPLPRAPVLGMKRAG